MNKKYKEKTCNTTRNKSFKININKINNNKCPNIKLQCSTTRNKYSSNSKDLEKYKEIQLATKQINLNKY